MADGIRVVFWGSPEFAVPFLDGLRKKEFEVPLVITQPDRPKGRSKKPLPTPVKEYALEHGITVESPEKIKNNEDLLHKLKEIDPDYYVVVAYGKILPRPLLEIPSKAPVNVHASLLPKYRGAAPIQWAIMNGERETGITIMVMNEGMDEGDILSMERVPIRFDDYIFDLEERLIRTGVDLLIKTLLDHYRGKIRPVPQTGTPTYAPMIKKSDGRINWEEDAISIYNKIRALVRWPVAHTFYKGKRVNIYRAIPLNEDHEGRPGEIVVVSRDQLIVQTGRGSLSILQLQREGKKILPVKDFLAGARLKPGEMFES